MGSFFCLIHHPIKLRAEKQSGERSVKYHTFFEKNILTVYC
jgi:hypothetical protein